MRRIALVLVVAVVMVSAVACSETPPDKLTMDPSGPFHFSKKGESEEVRLAAYKGKEPYVKKVDAEWKSSDPSVATVDGSGTGKISATGSGTATITATAWGLTSTAQVSVRIVGSVTVDEVKKPLHLSSAPLQLHVVVKDDKGKVIEKPERVMYRATDYCVEVSDDGVVKPLAEGDCDVAIQVADQFAKVKLSVQ